MQAAVGQKICTLQVAEIFVWNFIWGWEGVNLPISWKNHVNPVLQKVFSCTLLKDSAVIVMHFELYFERFEDSLRDLKTIQIF